METSNEQFSYNIGLVIRCNIVFYIRVRIQGCDIEPARQYNAINTIPTYL